MITDDKKSILKRVNFLCFFSFDLTHCGDYDDDYHARNLGSNDGSGD